MSCYFLSGRNATSKHLLFWLSLFPFAAGRMGENHFTAVPTVLYGIVLLMAAIAYHLLQQAIIRTQGEGSILKDVCRVWQASDWTSVTQVAPKGGKGL